MNENLNIKNEKIDIIKLLIYKESPAILEKINFDDDAVFLEPLLFAYFNSKKGDFLSSDLLKEIMQGYFIRQEPIEIKHSYNKNGIAYIPELGYYQRNKKVDDILIIDEFEIIKEVHPLIEKYFIEYYKGHIVNANPIHNSVWKDNYRQLEKSLLIIKKYLPDFYKELVFANKKIYLHDNPKILDFTTIETLGMLYFYVIGTDNLIYFIEELIHQGAHNYLYYVLHDRKEYFKIDVDNLIMRDYTNQEWDYRSIYGAFHGLYTVTKRVMCFDLLLSKGIFKGKQKHELLGRLTDQFARFRTGLELLNLEEVYTEKGRIYYKELDTQCATILNKYGVLVSFFDTSNRDVDFRYDDFCKLNSLEDYYKKERQEAFNFIK